MATRTKKTTTKSTPSKSTTKKAETGPVIKIVGQPEKPYRTNSARDLYWQAMQAHEGKSVSEYCAFVEDPTTCPLHSPAAKAANRSPEKGSGWFKFFLRNGLVQVA